MLQHNISTVTCFNLFIGRIFPFFSSHALPLARAHFLLATTIYGILLLIHATFSSIPALTILELPRLKYRDTFTWSRYVHICHWFNAHLIAFTTEISGRNFIIFLLLLWTCFISRNYVGCLAFRKTREIYECIINWLLLLLLRSASIAWHMANLNLNIHSSIGSIRVSSVTSVSLNNRSDSPLESHSLSHPNWTVYAVLQRTKGKKMRMRSKSTHLYKLYC